MVSPIQTYLAELHARYASLDEGEVATYIPELAKADPGWFGISIATTDGYVYEVGDTRQGFTIQSISKPFAYGLALEDKGPGAVLAKVGVEPSGDAFNSISLAPGTGRPLNPMINAGAIATTSLVSGNSTAEKLQRLLDVLSIYAGRPLTVDEAVFLSEKNTGHRNRAIGHMLRNFDILADDPTGALDVYFQQCSIEVTCRDLASMAATLANGGINPTTGERAIGAGLVDNVLSVMMSCGMYDYAGEWLYLVGAPAKSGVSGGIMAVWPGQLGIAVFSPRLDARGNSVRGIKVCQELCRNLNLHSLRVPSYGRNAVRAVYDLANVRSKRRRLDPERRRLDDVGRRAIVFELQGELMFAATEVAVRRIVDTCSESDVAIVDFRRVSRVDPGSATLLGDLFAGLGARGTRILAAGLRRHQALERSLAVAFGPSDAPGSSRIVAELDRALEDAENGLLAAAAGNSVARPHAVTLAEHDLLRGLSPEASAAVQEHMRPLEFRRGETLVRQGDAAGEIFLLTRGEVSVVIELPSGEAKRLSTLSAGMSFGELAVFGGTARTADVHADTDVECYILPKPAWDSLGDTHPTARFIMLENMFRYVSTRVAALSAEVAALEA